MEDEKDKIFGVLSKPVAVISLADGWLFKFDKDTLEELLEHAESSEDEEAIVFVKDSRLLN